MRIYSYFLYLIGLSGGSVARKAAFAEFLFPHVLDAILAGNPTDTGNPTHTGNPAAGGTERRAVLSQRLQRFLQHHPNPYPRAVRAPSPIREYAPRPRAIGP
eukprot:9466650-Pyramimonas_sp.AAC.1